MSGVAEKVGGPLKNLLILHILVSIPTKTYMRNTNMTLVFYQIHPCEQDFIATPLTTLIFRQYFSQHSLKPYINH